MNRFWTLRSWNESIDQCWDPTLRMKREKGIKASASGLYFNVQVLQSPYRNKLEQYRFPRLCSVAMCEQDIFLTLLRQQHLVRCGSGCGNEASPRPAGSPGGSSQRAAALTLLLSLQPAALPAGAAPQNPLHPYLYTERRRVFKYNSTVYSIQVIVRSVTMWTVMQVFCFLVSFLYSSTYDLIWNNNYWEQQMPYFSFNLEVFTCILSQWISQS